MADITVSTLAHFRDGLLLVVRKRGESVFILPGGKPEPGETDEAALRREIAEELGCALRPGSVRRVATFHDLPSTAPGATMAAIDHRHRQYGLAAPGDNPAVRRALKHARAAASRPARKGPRSPDELRELAAHGSGRDLAGLRDRALLLLLAAGLSCREVVCLQAEWLRFGEDGLRLPARDAVRLLVRASRHDHCPVRATEAWLAASATRYGPVFRKVTRWGTVEPQALGTDAVRLILVRLAV